MVKFNKLKKISAALIFAIGAITSIDAQVGANGLVNSQRTATVTATSFNSRMNEVYTSSAPEPLRGSLNLYKVTYRSIDANGKNALLSGLVIIPANGAPNGLVVFNHGTTVYNNNMPSRFVGTAKGLEPESAMLAFASGGYAIAMPDYIGQGDHAGGHPYPANVVNSRAGIDLIKPARAVARRNGLTIGNSLYITGYSEGGGVAMAQTRELERSNDPEFNVTAAAPASGPYDLSGASREFMLEQPTDQAGMVVRTYLLGDLVYYLHKNNGSKITEFFKPAMAFTINNSYGGKTKDEDIIKRIGVTALLMRSKNSIFNLITPGFRRAIETMDARNAAFKLLKDNDCYDWSPRNRMLLINFEGDTVVSPKNTQVAFETMRRRGVGANTLRRSVIRDSSLNHVTAVPAAMRRARNFFDGGFAGVRDLDTN
ncbi:MAG: alpha/beta hydrolase family protein [Pyrinomonadaceae bacterium]